MIRELGELDVDSLRRLQNLSDSLENSTDPSLLLAVQAMSDKKGEGFIEVDPRVLTQLVDSGQISPEVAQVLVSDSSHNTTSASETDRNLITALQNNPSLSRLLQFLPPKLRNVPNSVLNKIHPFDKLPKDLPVQPGLINVEKTAKSLIEGKLTEITEFHSYRNTDPDTGSLKLRQKMTDSRSPVRKKPNNKFMKNVLMKRLKPKTRLHSAKNTASNANEMGNNRIISSYAHVYRRRNMPKVHFKKFGKKWRPFRSRSKNIPSRSSSPHNLLAIKRHIGRIIPR